jgi:hypothetical protein
MIVTVPIRLLYLIFDRLLSWLLLLARTSTSKDIELSARARRTRRGRPSPDIPWAGVSSSILLMLLGRSSALAPRADSDQALLHDRETANHPSWR